MSFDAMNWPAVIAGVIVAYALGMLWFSPRLFGRVWATGTHNITRPDSPPVLAMALQLLATILLAMIIGLTETAEALDAALLAIATAAMLQLSMGLFSQKSFAAAMVDCTYVLAMGVVMIAAQAIL